MLSHNQKPTQKKNRRGERGNILFIILIAIVLIGALTAAISSSNNQDATIDNEQLAIRITEVQRYASELERAILFIQQNAGISESAIRFMNPVNDNYGDLSADGDRTDQVFDVDGGGANYRDPPNGVQTATGGAWEFYGGTHLPGVGSNRADLIAVLPNVTPQFCTEINRINGQTSAQPEDTGATAASGTTAGDCLHFGAAGRFGMTNNFYATANTTDATTFTKTPALQACVECNDGSFHFYHVLMAR